MDITIKPIEGARDFIGLAELWSAEGQEKSVDDLRQQELDLPVTHRVVVNEGDRIIGYGEVSNHNDRRSFATNILVHPEWRRRGIGTQIHDELLNFARGHGGTQLTKWLDENISDWDHNTAAYRFALNCGYKVKGQDIMSRLYPDAYDSTPFQGAVDAVRAGGIRLFTFADLPGTKQDRFDSYYVNMVCAMDIPERDPYPIPSFDTFVRDIFEGENFRPQSQILAADGDKLVGITGLSDGPDGTMTSNMTGVLREYRGRGIAFALKVLSLDYFKARRPIYVEAQNSGFNVPMYTVNRKIGFTLCSIASNLYRDIN